MVATGVKGSSYVVLAFLFSSKRQHTRYWRDWSSDGCSSDLVGAEFEAGAAVAVVVVSARPLARRELGPVPVVLDLMAALHADDPLAVAVVERDVGGRRVVEQIGRAWRREIVWISGVAGSFKN